MARMSLREHQEWCDCENIMADQKGTQVESFLSDNCPPMGIYETLYAFRDSFGSFMGTEGTHPWSQGFPLTTPLEKFGGPPLPASIDVTWEDRFYPKAWGILHCVKRLWITTTPDMAQQSHPRMSWYSREDALESTP